jgi:hypothetical protein
MLMIDSYGPEETFQIEIFGADTSPSYNVNLCGVYDITMTGFSIHFTTDPAFTSVAVASPQLTLNHYVSNNYTGASNAQYWSLYFPFTTHNANSMRLKVYYGDRYIQNNMQVSIINADTGAPLTNFIRALLTFDVRRKLNC